MSVCLYLRLLQVLFEIWIIQVLMIKLYPVLWKNLYFKNFLIVDIIQLFLEKNIKCLTLLMRKKLKVNVMS
ncbi:hypothetical protein C0V82_04625 [Niveispirillum cyanobacteriorum]|uniref:Uncharacterized protein n=1 Tax=Niveispirillum cyanobacteriorum TaxID=1612173 RepID=A0A2K9N925_9PROT|nr:hypothetical protein C0V82_04625 [Niveispirillum cyanobacteriorum]